MNKQNANVAIHRWVYHIIENNSNKCVRLLLILYELENDICVICYCKEEREREKLHLIVLMIGNICLNC